MSKTPQTTNRRECLFSIFLYNIILEALASVIKQEKEIKDRVERKKTAFADDIVYIQNLKNSKKKKKKNPYVTNK